MGPVADRMHGRWRRALQRRGFDSIPDKGGLDVRPASLNSDHLANYFVKLAMEMTSQNTKQARARKGRTPFGILRDIVEHHPTETRAAPWRDQWREWEQVSQHRQQLRWSKGLKRWAGVDDKSDQEIAEEDTGGEDEIALTGQTWAALVAGELTTDLLDAAEDGGMAGWLDAHGLDWMPANRGKREPVPEDHRSAQRHREHGWRMRALHTARSFVVSRP
jgi:hypothetical protein